MNERPERRFAIAAVWLLVTTGGAGALRLLWWYWPGSVFGSATSGTWTALAWDAAHGELYRPVLAPSGYGGTRYMPLLFLLHGGLIRAHVDPVHAAVALMQATVVAASAALYAGMRAAGTPARVALAFAGTTWATIAYQQYATEIRADYLAAAFAMTAVAAALSATQGARSTRLSCAGAACVLAGLTKLTAIAIAVPIAIGLLIERNGRAAALFVLGAAAAFAAALGAVQILSAGHFLENFRATLTAGMTASDLWQRGVPIFADYVVSDPFIAVPCAFAAWSAIVLVRRCEWSLPAAYCATSAIVTIVILASRGTATNHMVELQMAGTLVTAIAVTRGELPSRVVTPAYVALAVLMAAWSWPVPRLPTTLATLQARGPNRRATVSALRAEYGGMNARYLSLDPIVPVLSHERPFVADAFYLDLFVESGAPAGRDLERRVESREFDAILVRDADTFPRDMKPGDPDFDALCRRFWGHDLALLRLFRSTYAVREVRRPFVVLTPEPPGIPSSR